MPTIADGWGSTLLAWIAAGWSATRAVLVTPLGLTLLGLAVALAIVLLLDWRPRRRGYSMARVPAPYLAALHAWLAGRHGQAEADLQRVLAANPHHVDAALLLGNLYRRQGRHQQALSIHRELEVRRGLSRRQRIDVLAALLADAMASGMANQLLVPLADALLGLAPSHPVGLEVRIEAARRAGDLGQVMRLLEAAERHRQTMGGRGGQARSGDHGAKVRFVLFLCREGDQLRRAGRHDEARRFYRRALRHDEQHPAPHLGLAALAAAAGRDREALRICRRVAPYAAPELVIAGLEQLETAAAEELIQELAAAGLETEPDQPALRRAQARYHRRQGDSRRALEEIRRSVAAGDRSAATLRLGVELARQSGSSEAALELLLSALPAGAAEWRCRRCGAPAGEHDWRCEACGGWATLDTAGTVARSA